MKKGIIVFTVFITLSLLGANSAEAHRSGCHRWHSCPSDSGSYTCGDAGHPCLYPTYPASGGVIYPPANQENTYPTVNGIIIGSTLYCNEGFIASSGVCITHTQNCLSSFGPNTYGIKGLNSNSLCYCNSGYKWNEARAACVPVSLTATVVDNPEEVQRLQAQIQALLLQIEFLQKQLRLH